MSAANGQGKGAGMLTEFARRLLREKHITPQNLLPPPPEPPTSPPTLPPPEPHPVSPDIPVPDGSSASRQQSMFRIRPSIWEDYKRANQDLGERAQQALRRAGSGKRDPLMPIITLQSEMLARQTDLVADHIAAMERLNQQHAEGLRQTLADARTACAETIRVAQTIAKAAVAQAESAAAETITHQDYVRRTFETTFRDSATEAMRTWSRSQRWRDRLIAVVGCLGLTILTGWAALSYGHDEGREEALAAIKAGDKAFDTALLNDGLNTALHWVNLMNWNDLGQASRSCAPQQSGIGYRQVCTYTFWDGPPLPDSPPK